MLSDDDHFADRLADAIHDDLYEPWRDCDAWIVSFCPCSLTLGGGCSVKNRSRARRSRLRSCRRAERGRSADPGDGPSRRNPRLLNPRRAP
jgi:hypothetical protein